MIVIIKKTIEIPLIECKIKVALVKVDDSSAKFIKSIPYKRYGFDISINGYRYDILIDTSIPLDGKAISYLTKTAYVMTTAIMVENDLGIRNKKLHLNIMTLLLSNFYSFYKEAEGCNG